MFYVMAFYIPSDINENQKTIKQTLSTHHQIGFVLNLHKITFRIDLYKSLPSYQVPIDMVLLWMTKVCNYGKVVSYPVYRNPAN